MVFTPYVNCSLDYEIKYFKTTLLSSLAATPVFDYICTEDLSTDYVQYLISLSVNYMLVI
jgi:hypothetical protein